jgi:hypothetical protein
MPSKAGNSRVLASPIASNFSPANYGLGRGCGVGRGRGIALGVAVGEGVAVAVGVAVGVTLGVVVAVGVAVGVAVAVGVGVGEPPPTAARISTRPQPYTLFGGPASPHWVELICTAELFNASRLSESWWRRLGIAFHSKAIAPAMCGVAMEVPLKFA